MLIVLDEHDNAPDGKKRRLLSISITDENFTYDGILYDKETNAKARSVIEKYMSDIKWLGSMNIRPIEGSDRQMSIVFFMEDAAYTLYGNTDSKAMTDLYCKVRDELLEVAGDGGLRAGWHS